MRAIELTHEWIRGAVSIEKLDAGIKPWRLPCEQANLFYPILMERAQVPAGVRVAFLSDSETVELQWVATGREMKLDLVIDDQLIQSATVEAHEHHYLFEELSGSMKRIEIYLSQKVPIVLREMLIEDGALIRPLSDDRPRWITYGSSITQCTANAAEAGSPARTWPAIVARSKGWDLTCLGFGGQCHIEPMVARVIRDLQADIISLCLGINVHGNGSLNIRTFRSAVIGMVSIIREKHAHTPLYLFSPIYCAPREETENQAGLSLVMIREEIQEAVRMLESCGDYHLFYIDGLNVFGEEYAGYLPDNLHPNAEGYEIMAQNIIKLMG